MRGKRVPQAESEKSSGLPPTPEIRHDSQADAVKKIWALPLPGEGFTLTVIGMPRSGKTFFARKLVESSDLITLIHDPKVPTGYAKNSHPMESATDISDTIPANQATGEIKPDHLANAALYLAREGEPCLIVFDEATRILDGAQRFQEGGHLRLLWSEGGSQGVSTVLLTQCPQWLPRECVDFTTATIFFRLRGRSLTAVSDLYRLTDRQIGAISNLDPGQFILLTAYDDWDQTVYGPG